MSKNTYLKKVPLFSEFNTKEFKLLEKICGTRLVKKDELIFDEHSSGNCLYIVISGNVKIFASSAGKKKTLAYLSKGEFFGEMSLIDMEPRSASSVALDDCKLLILKKKDFRLLLEKYPRISILMMQTLSKRLRQADKEIESLVFENVMSRVSATLLGLASKYGEKTSSGSKIKMHLSQQDIAELTGTAREMVSRILNKLRRMNCITYTKCCLTVVDNEKLRKFV